jgi:hypothetical protein
MKTPEDEAFDELARKQGAWGGGFPAKRQMAMDKIHAEFYEKYVRNRTAFPKEYTAPQPAQEPVACERCKQLEEQAYDLLGQLKAANLKWSVAHPWVGLTDQESIDIIKKDDNYKYPIKLLQAVMDALKAKNT